MANSKTPTKASKQTKDDIDYQIVSSWRSENNDLPLLYPHYETLEDLEKDMNEYRALPVDMQIVVDDRSKIIFGHGNVQRYKALKHDLLVEDSQKLIIYQKEPKTKLKDIDPINAMMMLREYATTNHHHDDFVDAICYSTAVLEAMDYKADEDKVNYDKDSIREEVADNYYTFNIPFSPIKNLPDMLPSEIDTICSEMEIPNGWGKWKAEYNRYISGLNNEFPIVHENLRLLLKDRSEDKLWEGCGYIPRLRDGRVKDLINNTFKRISIIDIMDIEPDILDSIQDRINTIPDDFAKYIQDNSFEIQFREDNSVMIDYKGKYYYLVDDNGELFVEEMLEADGKPIKFGYIVISPSLQLPEIIPSGDNKLAKVTWSPTNVKLLVKELVTDPVVLYQYSKYRPDLKYYNAIYYTEYASGLLKKATKQLIGNIRNNN